MNSLLLLFWLFKLVQGSKIETDTFKEYLFKVPIDLNFHLQKNLEIFDKKLADTIQSKYYEGDKSALPHSN